MTAPTVTVLPKPETVLDVDLSAEVECGACHEEGAIWWLTQHPCGHGYPVCQWCHDYAQTLELPADAETIYGCDRCESICLSITFRRL